MATERDHVNDPGTGERPADDGRRHRPDLLVIGATGRSSGKTELACQLISRQVDSTPVVGLKVTIVERADGSCPHGRAGCGMCSSLSEPWIVSRELDRESPKDTCRLLASGACQVYWLRVLRSELGDGAADLLTRVPSGWLGVCESNSIREVVEPGLFLLVRSAESRRAKPSARAVAHLADRVVVSDGRSFDLDLDRISVVDGQWALRRDACAVVVEGAGGRHQAGLSAALRRTRASLEPQFERVVVGPGTPGRSARWGAEPFPADLRHEWCLVTPPVVGGVPPGLVNALFRRRAEADVVVGVNRSAGRDACLALCRRTLLSEVIASLGQGVGVAAALGDRCVVRELRLGASGSESGLERLPAPAQRAPASRQASRRGAEAP